MSDDLKSRLREPIDKPGRSISIIIFRADEERKKAADYIEKLEAKCDHLETKVQDIMTASNKTMGHLNASIKRVIAAERERDEAKRRAEILEEWYDWSVCGGKHLAEQRLETAERERDAAQAHAERLASAALCLIERWKSEADQGNTIAWTEFDELEDAVWPMSTDCPGSEPAASGDAEGRTEAKCEDCGRPYGDEHGFPDLIIEKAAWQAISPTGDDGGLLCPSCICRRLHEAGITTGGAFMSGPIESVSRFVMNNTRSMENRRAQMYGAHIRKEDDNA